jgi:hypothetical protein
MRVRGLAAVLVLATATLAPGKGAPATPGQIRALLTRHLPLTDSQFDEVRRGDAVVLPLDTTVPSEIAVGGAVRIDAPASRLVAVIRDIERLERGGGFIATKKFSSPPVLADMATLRLPEEDVASLRTCRVGRCDVKLGQRALESLARIDWDASSAAAHANELVRRMALEYVQRYRSGGNAALAVYQDGGDPISTSGEFEDMVRRSSGLTTIPEVPAYLLRYPQARPAGVQDFFYWSLAAFGLKPVLRLNHVLIQPMRHSPGLQYVITTKQLYASHYFHTALEVRVLVDDAEHPGRAHYLVALNFARSDGLGGLLGGIIKGKAKDGALDGLKSALGTMKRRAERS